MVEAHQAIKVVAQRTGLSPHVIRIWEKRYGAVKPERTGTNRRLYSEEEIERLNLLREITQHGHSISYIAKLPTAKLRDLVREDPPEAESQNGAAASGHVGQAGHPFLSECIDAVKRLDARALDEALKRGSVELGAQGLLQRVVAPLAQTLGDLWADGTITAAHEHFASAVIRIFLGHTARPFAGTEAAPAVVVATPSGQIHELGALLAGAAASNLGWNVTYLGASLPAAEIAGAARQCRARAVALSLVYPEDDPRMEAELSRLREALPPEIPLLVGGRAAQAYGEILEKIGATEVKDLTHLGVILNELRKPGRKAK